MAYYDRRSGRYYSPSPPPHRSGSKTDAFLDNLERGRVKDAFGSILPEGSKRHQSQRGSHRRRRYEEEYYPSDDEDYYYEENRPSYRHSRHKDDGYHYEEALPRHRGRSVHPNSRDPYRSTSHRRHRARSESGPNWRQATEAAVGAGLIEGWRARNNRERIGRVATAAAGAAGTAMLVGREGDRKNKRHIAEATIGGLMVDRVVNGSRKR
ncbi:hypothetical protein AB5N19_03435 [Seiridium cardinale]